jgi:hypothetical protein
MRRADSSRENRPRGGQRPIDLHVLPCRTGRGVFAARRFDPHQIVGEILGSVIADPHYSSSYCYEMGDDRCLEPDPPFRFLNHSCSPNCRFQWYDVTSDREPTPRRRVFVLALRAIASGEQLTIDYRWPIAMAIPCRCGAADCRGWVVDRTELGALAAATNEPSA